GIDGQLYIVQSRPETVSSQRTATLDSYVLDEHAPVLISGRSVGEKIATGRTRHIDNVTRLGEFRPGEVLIADTTTPDWEPVMKRARARVTTGGGRTCRAAIVARELGIPAVVGTVSATTVLPEGEMVTVCCAEGDVGQVYRGTLGFHVDHLPVAELSRPDTHV